MLRWIWLSVLVIVLDQVSKYFASALLALHEPVAVLPGFNLTLMHNTGAAFSFLAGAGGWQRWVFVGISTLASIFLTVWLYRLGRRERWLALALALVLGGAIGNLWDRLTLGYVVDFIQVYYQRWYWPAFNIADSAITVGAVMLVIEAFFFKKKDTLEFRR